MLFKVSAPGKIIISGEHSVVYNHDAICGSIALRCHVQCHRSTEESESLTINLSNINQVINIGLDSAMNFLKEDAEAKRPNDTQNFHELYWYKVVVAFKKLCQMTSKQTIMNVICMLMKNHLTIKIHSDIPIGKGLGSSAALSVCFATTICQILKFFTKIQIAKNLINSIAYEFQKIYHSNPSGLDNTISLFGGLYLYNRQKDLQPLKWNLPDLQVGLVDSGVQKNTKKAVQHVKQLYMNSNGSNQATIVGTIIQKISEVTQNIKECVENGNAEEFLKLIKANHQLLKDLGLSNTVMQDMIDGLAGCSCKITGAGMGGQILVFAREKRPGVVWIDMCKEGAIVQRYNEWKSEAR